MFKRQSRKADFAHYQQIITAQQVTLVVVGLPTYLDGSDSDFTRWVRHYSAELQTNLTIPLVLHDENFSTERARQNMVQRGMSCKKRQANRDAVAAAFILQDYLNHYQHSGI